MADVTSKSQNTVIAASFVGLRKPDLIPEALPAARVASSNQRSVLPAAACCSRVAGSDRSLLFETDYLATEHKLKRDRVSSLCEAIQQKPLIVLASRAAFDWNTSLVVEFDYLIQTLATHVVSRH